MSSPYSCIPDTEALSQLRSAWSWCLPKHFEVLLVTAFGDVFFEVVDEGIYWLNTGTAEVEPIAADRGEFKAKLEGEEGEEWLLPDLVQELQSEGKVCGPGECYTYAILPIFAEGKFETWNFKPVAVAEHFGVTADIHRQISELPDGARLEISIEP